MKPLDPGIDLHQLKEDALSMSNHWQIVSVLCDVGRRDLLTTMIELAGFNGLAIVEETCIEEVNEEV